MKNFESAVTLSEAYRLKSTAISSAKRCYMEDRLMVEAQGDFLEDKQEETYKRDELGNILHRGSHTFRREG